MNRVGTGSLIKERRSYRQPRCLDLDDRYRQHRCRTSAARSARRSWRSSDVVQKVPLPGYTENRRSRARKGIRCFEWNLDLNHALVAGGWRGGRDARRVRMDVCTNAPGARRDSNMAADTYLLRDSMQ